MGNIINLSRRGFIKSSLVLGGGLIVGCSTTPTNLAFLKKTNQGASSKTPTWIQITKNGRITIFVPSVEMGQGVSTSLTMIVADELDADLRDVDIDFVPIGEEYNHPEFSMQATGGSSSIKGWWMPLRRAGAAARSMLVEEAARRWKVPTRECHTRLGEVFHSSGSKFKYAELAEGAAALEAPESPALKSPAEFRYIGKALPRLDTSMKIQGTCPFGIDVEVPGMVHATLAHSPVFGGTVKQINRKAALAIKGVESIVVRQDWVAVVAANFWSAKKGLEALSVEFDDGPHAELSSSGIRKEFQKILDAEGKDEFPKASQIVEAEYEVPYLAHATMEPMNFTAHVTPDHCEVWGPTQSPTLVGKTIEKLTGLSGDQVTLHTTYMGGGFGRRIENDFVTQAVSIAQEVQKPVKLIWTREEDIQHDFFRQSAMIRFQLGLDKRGKISHWSHQHVTSSLLNHYFPLAVPGFLSWLPISTVAGDPFVKEGATEESMPYAIEKQNHQFSLYDLPVPIGFWRSVGQSHNSFFIESAIDEAAHAAKQDPYQYRRLMLKNDYRYLNVMEVVAKKVGWGKPPRGRFHGMGVCKSFDTYVAEVAEISVSPTGQLQVHRIVCAVDCGVVVNPDIVTAQIEGGVIYGLAAALDGEITIEKGRVVQSNFHDYRVLRLADAPKIEVHIVPSDEAPTGVGEPGTPPVAPAVTNAIFAATGKRIRSLPISKHSLKPV